MSNQAAFPDTADKTILACGSGGTNPIFIRYIAALTKKPNPKILYVPTATADNPNNIVNWYTSCENLPVRPYVMKTFIASAPSQQSFEEMILSMDAILVGGGNTLNMIAIWKAHGIDEALRKAYDQGIVMAGGSAGSLCWFNSGYSDSRPKHLSIVDGLGFLDYTHCPHYHSEPGRKPLYFKAIQDGIMQDGYACDDFAGLVFINGRMTKAVSFNQDNNAYFIHLADGKVQEDLIPAEIIR